MRSSIFIAIPSVLALVFAACSSAPDTCASGTACVSCDLNQSCGRMCEGTNCSFTCNGNGSCHFSCPQGGCTATNNGNGSLELDCAGGGCTVNCEGNGSCAIADCPTCTCNDAPLGGTCTHM